MRKWISLLLTFSLLVLILTGIVLYIEPHGRYAYWTGWRLFGLDKSQWDGIHIIFGFLFIFFGLWHILLNLKVLKKYFTQTVPLIATQLIILAIFVGTARFLPPFNWVLNFEEKIKQSWQQGGPKDFTRPLVPHAEQMSFARVVRLMGLSPRKAMEFLRQKGFKISDVRQEFGKVAAENGLSPAELFKLLKENQARLWRGQK